VTSPGVTSGQGAPSGGTTPTTTPSVSVPQAPSVQSLQQTNPGAQTYGATTAQGSTVSPLTQGVASTEDTGLIEQAKAAQTNISGLDQSGNYNPADATNAAAQLSSITSENSPYIQLAEQQGLLSAASRGLENSSFGAGAAESAAVQAATPLALQNAQGATTGALQNAQLSTQTSEQKAAADAAAMAQNAQLTTQASEFNASQDAAAKELNAQIAAQTNQFNASQAQSAAATNAAAQNTMTAQTMSLNSDINKQYLSGTQAMDLASIQGQYNQLIQSNSAASSLYNSYFQSISQIMANKDIPPDRVASSVQALQSMLNSGLSVIDQLNGMNLGTGVGTGPGSGNATPPPTTPSLPRIFPIQK
jgi:hypothetical protein